MNPSYNKIDKNVNQTLKTFIMANSEITFLIVSYETDKRTGIITAKSYKEAFEKCERRGIYIDQDFYLVEYQTENNVSLCTA